MEVEAGGVAAVKLGEIRGDGSLVSSLSFWTEQGQKENAARGFLQSILTMQCGLGCGLWLWSEV